VNFQPLHIDAVGAISPVGLNAGQTFGSLRAGISKMAEIPVIGVDGEPVHAGMVPLSDGGGAGDARIMALTSLALRDCARGYEEQPAPLILACPSAAALSVHPAGLLRNVADHTRVALNFRHSEVIQGGGPAGFAVALNGAQDLIRRDIVRTCYVGAADTFLDGERLVSLLSADRIVGSRTPDGFAPGEAAVILRLSARPTSKNLGSIVGVGLAEEEATRDTARISGVGQTAAARAALNQAGLSIADVSWLGVDLAGERHRFYEVALTVTRLKPHRTQQLEQWNGVPLLGNVGCALAPLTVGYLATAFMRGWMRSVPNALFLGADDGKLRAAIALKGRASG
jgi:3-oxoacyl-[acyl-carrier-protein] synthase I